MNREGTMKSYWDQIFLSAIEMRLALSRWNSRTLSPLNWSEFSTFIYSDLEEKNHCSCPGSSSPSFGNCTLISVCEQSQLLWGNQNTAWLWPCHWFRGRHVPQATPKRRSPGKNTGVGCHFLLQGMKVKSESEGVQSCPTLSDPMDCSLPGSSVHGIFQARVLEWGAIAFSIISTRKV